MAAVFGSQIMTWAQKLYPFFHRNERELKTVWKIEGDGRRGYMAGTAHFSPFRFQRSLQRLIHKARDRFIRGTSGRAEHETGRGTGFLGGRVRCPVRKIGLPDHHPDQKMYGNCCRRIESLASFLSFGCEGQRSPCMRTSRNSNPGWLS